MSAPAIDSSRGIWKAIREAIHGSHQDFTEGSINKAIFLLAVPMVLEMAMESTFGLVNIFWVSGLGSDAVSIVGVTEALLTTVFAIAMGLSMAVTAMVARRIGEKDPEQAAVTAVQGIILGGSVAVVLAALGIAFGDRLLALMQDGPAIVEKGSVYTRTILGNAFPIMMTFLINAIFRGAGDASIAMRALWIGNIVNMVLDPCLIFGWGPFPKLGIEGAAIANTIGRSTTVVYQLWQLFGGNGRIRIARRHLQIVPETMRGMLAIAVPGSLQFLIDTASWVALVKTISLFGPSALAGYTIAIRVIIVTILPSWGVSNAAATLMGQNLGAKKPERAEASVWRCGFFNMIVLTVVALFFIVFARPIVGFFTADPVALESGIDCLRWISYGYPLFAYALVMISAFNGAGDTVTPTIINICCHWLFKLPLAYLLAKTMGMGPKGAYIAVMVAESVVAVVSIMIFRRGKWKERKV